MLTDKKSLIFIEKMKMRNKGEDGNDYELLTPYIRSNEKVTFFHKTCERTFEMTPNRFLCGDNCSKCRKDKMRKRFLKDTDYLLKRMKEQNLLDEYEPLEEYKGSRVDMKFLHKICGRSFYMTPNDLLDNGNRCPKCAKPHSKFDPKEVRHEFEKMFKDKYVLLNEYKDSTTPLEIQCLNCGEIFERLWYNIRHNAVCPNCEGKKTPSTFRSIKRTFDKYNDGEYELLTTEKTYVCNTEKLEILHTICNEPFEMNIYHFKAGNKCPHCRTLKQNSRESQIIEDFLIENCINYTREQKFDTCKNKRNLSFDFYIKSRNLIIEYDGIQHFKPKFSEESFKDSKLRDSIKDKWALENDISLLRLSYKLSKDQILQILKSVILNEQSSKTISLLKESTIDAYWKQETPCFYKGEDIV